MRSAGALVLVTAGLFELASAPAATAEPEHGFVERTYRGPDGKDYRYVLFVPYAYQGDKPFPLIVFLHGSGEGGTDPQKPVRIALGKAIKKQEKTFPFFVVFPQARKQSWAADSEGGQRALALVDEAARDYRVDPKRLYLTGFSLGGDGTWELAASYPKRWAAIVPVCGVPDPADAKKIKDVPCWCFEGAKDNAKDVAKVHAMIQALKDLGANVRCTEYPNRGHGVWDPAYGTPELYDWLLQQHRQ